MDMYSMRNNNSYLVNKYKHNFKILKAKGGSFKAFEIF